jgi:hypothetical protein
MNRMAGDALSYLRQLVETATIADVARRHVPHQWRGSPLMGNMPELYQDAVRNVEESGLPLTPANIRRSAKDVLDRVDTMYEESIGIEHDELGIPLAGDPYAPVSSPAGRLDLGRGGDDYWDTPF